MNMNMMNFCKFLALLVYRVIYKFCFCDGVIYNFESMIVLNVKSEIRHPTYNLLQIAIYTMRPLVALITYYSGLPCIQKENQSCFLMLPSLEMEFVLIDT